MGLQNMAQHIDQNLQIMSQDDQSKEMVRMLQQQLSQVMNLVKGFMKNLQTAMAKQNGQQQGGGMDPKDQAKIAATVATAKSKMEITKESHAQRTAQRQIQFEQKVAQDQRKSQLELEKESAKAQLELQKQAEQAKLELHAEAALTQQEIAHNEMRKASEPEPSGGE